MTLFDIHDKPVGSYTGAARLTIKADVTFYALNLLRQSNGFHFNEPVCSTNSPWLDGHTTESEILPIRQRINTYC